MKKVALLGDSIRLLGYGTRVPEFLGPEFQVYQPEDNCRFAKYTLRGICIDWKQQLQDLDVIHWNNGLWDVCDLRMGDGVFTPEDEYMENMVRIAKLLQKQSKTVIFATTTPVRPENIYNDNERIIAYNRMLVPVLQEMGIIINDLHSLVWKDVEKYIRAEDSIHLTDAGIELCARETARIIREASCR